MASQEYSFHIIRDKHSKHYHHQHISQSFLQDYQLR